MSLIAKMTGEAHRLGMKIAIDCEPHTQIAGRAPIQAKHYFHLHGRLPSHTDGELIVYVSFADEKLIDFWSEATRDFYSSVVECYKEIPLDGIS